MYLGGTVCWAYHSAVSSFSLCHSDGNVSAPQILPLQEEEVKTESIISQKIEGCCSGTFMFQ